MARPQRIEYAGAVYHGTARGNERRAIFLDDANRQRLLCVLGESVERFDVRLYLFCLMSNHIHRAVEPGVLLRRRRNSPGPAIVAKLQEAHAER